MAGVAIMTTASFDHHVAAQLSMAERTFAQVQLGGACWQYFPGSPNCIVSNFCLVSFMPSSAKFFTGGVAQHKLVQDPAQAGKGGARIWGLLRHKQATVVQGHRLCMAQAGRGGART